MRARFYASDGSYLSYRNAYVGDALNDSYQLKAGTVTAPANAASMKVQLFGYLISGWVTYDDIAVGGLSEANATTTYYEGNAMRRTGHASDNGLFYLVRDHLGSSSVIANQNGTVAKSDTPMAAIGRRSLAR